MLMSGMSGSIWIWQISKGFRELCSGFDGENGSSGKARNKPTMPITI
jgi:hypothetical protein